MKIELIVLGVALVVCFFIASVFAIPKSKLHSIQLFESKKNPVIIAVTVIVTTICSTIPMNLSPMWNGEIPEHRNQYEVITESFLEGHIYFDYEIDDALKKIDNPYNPDQRNQNNVDFHWDHSYYNGKYYMYFGVVPVILVFLPFRIITGVPLTTYHATQLFVALFIIGLFLVFYELAKKFFNNISLSVYLYLSVAFSVMSIFYSIATPALYCTAITSGLATIIWGLYFWIKAIWDCEKRSLSIVYSSVGSLLGALTFGCRPPIALGNIIILGLMIYYLKNKNFKHKWIDVLSFSIPYVIIACLLMVYNYARFNSFFEFGQSYQLTSVDVKNTPNLFNTPSIVGKIKVLVTYFENFIKYLFEFSGIRQLTSNGTFITFPILFYIFIGFENELSRDLIKQKRIRLFLGFMMLTPVLILILDVIGSPDVLARYRMDTYWIFGLIAFMIIGLIYQIKNNKRKFSSFICFFSVFTIMVCVILFAFPNDMNFTQYYNIVNKLLLLLKE